MKDLTSGSLKTSSDVPQASLSALILLTTAQLADTLIPVIRQHAPDIELLVAPDLPALRDIPASTLNRARLLSFLSIVVVPADILDAVGFGAYNFHPGPPSYPGWAPFAFAIDDGATGFGATVHQMAKTVDTGSIVGVDFFPIPSDADVAQLSNMCLQSTLRQFTAFAARLATDPELLPPLPIPWARHRTTKRDFAERCDIPLDISEDELRRRVRAFGQGDGNVVPTITVHGYRFRLALP